MVKGTTRFVAREILILIGTLEKEKLVIVISSITSDILANEKDGTKFFVKI